MTPIAPEHGAEPVDVAANLGQVRGRIRTAEHRFERPPGSVALLAVSKRQSSTKIRAAFPAGQRDFGESYVHEALEKMNTLTDLAIRWHFIGRIQSNKTREIAKHFAWVHSLCDVKHARRLSEQRPPELPALRACIQVNLSGEPSKAGLPPEVIGGFLEACAGLPGLDLSGLMTLPAPAVGEDEQRRPFRELRQLRDGLATTERPLAVLSMGMSYDLEAAIAEGATMVRVGTAVFGPRSP